MKCRQVLITSGMVFAAVAACLACQYAMLVQYRGDAINVSRKFSRQLRTHDGASRRNHDRQASHRIGFFDFPELDASDHPDIDLQTSGWERMSEEDADCLDQILAEDAQDSLRPLVCGPFLPAEYLDQLRAESLEDFERFRKYVQTSLYEKLYEFGAGGGPSMKSPENSDYTAPVIALTDATEPGPSAPADKNSAVERPNGPQLNSRDSDPETSVPGELPAAEDATPIKTSPAWRSAMRSLIEQELPGASEAEKRVWEDELKGVPPSMMRDLLRLRRNMGTATTPLPEMWADPEVFSSSPREDAETPGPFSTPVPVAELDVGFRSHVAPALAALDDASRVVLNNIANAETVGFKRSRVVLQDLPYLRIQESGASDSTEDEARLRTHIGMGVRLAGVRLDVRPGELEKTGGRLDLAIDGDGFFTVVSEGETLYTRCGEFVLNAKGEIATIGSQQAYRLDPTILVPADSTGLEVAADGTVAVFNNNEKANPGNGAMRRTIGRIKVVSFRNPEALAPRGGRLYAQTPASGSARAASPGENGRGAIRQGALEGSNVIIEDELEQLSRLAEQRKALLQAAALTSPDVRNDSSIAIEPGGRLRKTGGTRVSAPHSRSAIR